jgi:myo-inositol catabolism protein IolC
VADLARSDGREGVACVVLGRGADDRAVERWLRAAAGVPGYVGFAIGRTIWWDPLAGYLEESLDRDAAAERIAAAYRHMVDVYRDEAGLARRGDAQ